MVSVVIPFFENYEHLAAALESVERQSYSDWEIVVVDDGSTAERSRAAKEIVGGIAKSRFLSTRNSGAGAARNHGVSEANGKWIAFLDADDLWHDEKIDRQLRFMMDNGFRASACGAAKVDESGRFLETNALAEGVNPECLPDDILYGRVNSFTSSLVIERQYFLELGGFNPPLRHFEDHLLLLQLVLDAKLGISNEVLAFRRLHDGSYSGHQNLVGDFHNRSKSLEAYFAFVRTAYPSLNAAPPYSRWCLRLARLADQAGFQADRRRLSWRGFASNPWERQGWACASEYLKTLVTFGSGVGSQDSIG